MNLKAWIRYGVHLYEMHMDWYKVTGMKWLVWIALICSALVRSDWFGMKWPRYEVTLVWSALIWSDLGMKCIGMKLQSVWSDWYEVALVWSALVWSDFDMKCRMVCSALVWSAWYEVTIFPFGMKWRKKWSAGWMKWLGTEDSRLNLGQWRSS